LGKRKKEVPSERMDCEGRPFFAGGEKNPQKGEKERYFVEGGSSHAERDCLLEEKTEKDLFYLGREGLPLFRVLLQSGERGGSTEKFPITL